MSADIARRGTRAARSARGVSLIEALVAFAVLGFGMLGVAGMQATLRYNGDIAKQRSEAVRIAQESLEDWRAFPVLNPTPGYAFSYAGIASAAQADVAGYTTNTTYKRTGTVVESVPPGQKVLVADVEWTDRSGVAQSVRLSSLVAGVAPELAATLVAPSSGVPARPPLGRHRAIPPQARDFGSASVFLPPQPSGGTVAWRFDNVSGLFKECSSPVQDYAVLALADLICSNAENHMLLSGYVRYATRRAQPQPVDVGDAYAIGGPDPDAFPVPMISIVQTAPSAGSRGCHVSSGATLREYFCGIPVDTTPPTTPPKWSGSIAFDASLPIASPATDARKDRFRVCRYAFVPAAYANVLDALQNQNFVIIRAGDDTNPYSCPSGVTVAHQPPP